MTYPLPKGKIEAVEEKCPECGMPQIKVTAFRSKPRIQCIDPNCPTNHEPDIVVGKCPDVRREGPRQAAHRVEEPAHAQAIHSLRELRGMRDGLPLPQYGKLTATEETCPRLRRSHGNCDHRPRPGEAVPELQLPGQKREAAEKAAKAEAKKAEKAAKPVREEGSPPKRRPPKNDDEKAAAKE